MTLPSALCCAVDAALRSHAPLVRSRREPNGAKDIYLGKKSDLLARSSTCQSCRALVSCAEEDSASFSKSQAPICAGDYDFSAHLMDRNPVLCIAFGSLPSESTDASQRRQLMKRPGVLSLFSTDQHVPEHSDTWLAGRPRLFDPNQRDPSLIRGWLDHYNRFRGNRCLVSQAWRCKADVVHNFIDVELECIVSPTAEIPFAALSYVGE
ncbi:hypothetical protein RRF57_002329 [Xylaria bambusicola]|uniref:Uncharacterized protein n=1 Tax=Xylaria bambusicola TaxID=326684 RepID=A0AAN7USN3_9PEZI